MERRSDHLTALVVLLAVYFLAGTLGLKLAFVHPNATAVWAPTGIALAGFLIFGYRVWPAIFLGAFLVNITAGLVAKATGNTLQGLLDTFLANITTTTSVATSIGIAAGNTLEGLLGAYLVNRFADGRRAFDHPRTVFKFAVLAGMVSTTVSATIGVTSLSLSGAARWADYGPIWLTWWLGDAVGALIVAPLFILWSAKPRPQWSRARVGEAALLLLALFLVDRIVFAGSLPVGFKNYPLTFLCVPPAVWAAFRFGQRETVTVSCLLSGIAIRGTLHGYGPFVGGTQNESLIFLQAFMGVIVVMAMSVNAVVSEHQRAEEGLRKAHAELELRVQERTAELAEANRSLVASREQLAEAQQIAQVGSWEWNLARNIVRCSDELYHIYGLKRQETPLTYENFLECVHPEDRPVVRETVERARRDHKPFSFDHRIVLPDATERILHGRGRVVVDPSGNAVLMVGTSQDITVRKLAETTLSDSRNDSERRVRERTAELAAANEAFLAEIVDHKRTAESLRESQTKFQAIFEHSVEAISVSKAGIHVMGNPAYVKLFGYGRPEELVGLSVLECIAPAHREFIGENVRRRANGEAAPAHYETRGRRKDGSEFDLEVDVSSYKLKSEIYTLAILHDVTERKRAEEARDRLAAIVESSGDAIISMTLDGTIASWNAAAERIYGYSVGEVRGRPITLLVPPELHDEEAKILERIKRGERITHYETVRLRKGGPRIAVSLTISPIKDSTGRIVGASKISRDITERRRAAEAMRESEALKSAILESALDCIIAMNHEGKIIEWNPAAEKTFGYRRAEVLGREMSELIVPASLRERHRQGLARCLATGEGPVLGKRIEMTGMRADGSEFPAELAITRIQQEGPPMFTGYVRDITERKRAEEALRQSEARKSAILETALDAILSIDHEGNVHEWNPAAEKIFGYGKPEALGKRMDELIIPASLREYYHDSLAEYLMTGVGSLLGRPIELTVVRADGTEFRAELAITRNSWDEPTMYTCFLRDITERKRAEREIRELNTQLEQRVIERTAQLEAINKELESFTYSVSHDLRAPLRALQGLSNAVLEDYAERLDDVGKDYCRRIVTAAGRMDTLIQDLLSYSRLSRTDLELKPIDLAAVVADVRHQLESDLRERKAKLEQEGVLPTVLGHRATLGQLAGNLVSNAIKFVAPGVTPRVRIWAEEKGEFVRLWVEDNGIGIAPEHQERIFRIFERLHGVETYPGTGIGLAIVQKGAERLGGRVGLESSGGQGSRFWVELKKGPT